MTIALPRMSLAILACLIAVNCLCTSCHLQPNATVKDLERFVVMDFKKRLMKKLGITKEPKNAADVPLPILKEISRASFQANDQAAHKKEPSTKITDIIVSPLETRVNIFQNMLSLTFQVLEVKDTYEMAGIKLWLNVKNIPVKKHWFQIYDKTKWGKQLVLTQSITSSTTEWHEFKFLPNKQWSKTPWKKLHLEIVGVNDKFNKTVISIKGKNIPHLQTIPRLIKRRLNKRDNGATSDDCQKPGLCCKQSFIVNVTQQMPWILYPRNIQTGICQGSCPALYRSRWAWSMLLQIRNKRRPCCVPSNLLPMSAVYKNDRGDIIQTLVNDMVVDSCSCS